MRVLIVDDSKQSQFYMQSVLKTKPEAELVATITSAANAELYCLRDRVDLILMDICTADNASGLTVAQKIKQNYPRVKIIMVTSMPEHSFIERAKAAGCEGFWYKEYGEKDILAVIDEVMAGRESYPEKTPRIRVGCATSEEFSEREYEVVRLLADGMSRQQIGEILCISPRTVRFYIEELKTKTGYEDTMKMVADFVEQKLIINNLE